ncbi:hypothetical protein FNV43_RR08818 [Rhamnella rubrinervis]|uniref:Toll-like receptor 3 n=1 Tax=Rhamnella rubrinervis TaxID=2594499 RepID=A0A8K0HA34_9ROSA|nr:hypothetical protein FNV43_RR08818 [Rhamnella rubrinervis]
MQNFFSSFYTLVFTSSPLLQGHKEWVTEVNVLGVVDHPNLVKLLGYCAEDDERGIQRLLIYEYMPNRSVLDHLSSQVSILDSLDLSSNHLEGPVPRSIFKLKNLSTLSLSSNKFNGTIELVMIKELGNLFTLDLSHNYLSVSVGDNDSTLSSSPKFGTLKLASCKLSRFPYLKNQSNLFYLDLSDNEIDGEIPNWIWDVGNGFLLHVNLSYNQLVALRCNFLLPIKNSLTGVLPHSICNVSCLQVLDLSDNRRSGRIPECLSTMTLGVLNLQRNNFSGSIPDAFQDNCVLQTLAVNGNSIEGKIPRSLANCKALEIIDLAFNNFNGNLPGRFLGTWEAMKADENEFDHLRFEIFQQFYQDTVTVTSKGLQFELVKIITLFTSIDFSFNNFHGKIPKELGQLKALHVLNLSNNALSGQIPSSFGNMQQLESLDLSNNQLKGEIPSSISNLNFLEFLNLQLSTEWENPDWESNSNVSSRWFRRQSRIMRASFTKLSRWRKWYFDGVEDIAFSILPQNLLRKWLSWKAGTRRSPCWWSKSKLDG